MTHLVSFTGKILKDCEVFTKTSNNKPHVEFQVVDSQVIRDRKGKDFHKKATFTVRCFGAEDYLVNYVIPQAKAGEFVTIFGQIEDRYEDGKILQVLVPQHRGLIFPPPLKKEGVANG